MLNPNLKSINRRKRVKVDLKILRGRILKFFHNRKSEVILGVFCKNQFDSQSLGGGIFDRLQLFSRTKFRVLSDFQVQNEKITIFPIFRSSFPLFATLFQRVQVLRKGVPPVYTKLAEDIFCDAFFNFNNRIFTDDVIAYLYDQKWSGSSNSVIRGLNKSILCNFIIYEQAIQDISTEYFN